jgi:hypothetical protein
MSANEPPSSLVDRDGLRFDLFVYPEAPTRPWRADLFDASGGWRSFATPLELIRHLAHLGMTPMSRGGLR